MEGESVGAAARQWRVGQWLADGSMEAVAEINAQCLDFLCALATDPAQRLPDMFAGQLDAWRELSVAARAQLAASPYLLAEAGFDDESRWLLPARRMVQDLPTPHSQPVFTGPGAPEFIRAVLVLGWHLARANRQLARVVLGMTPACATRIAALRLRDLDWVVQHHPEWVRPRWERQPRVWRHLLGAVREPDGALLSQVSLRGLQLLAANVLGTSAGVRARSSAMS
jgi:hypothetical protein